MTEYIWDRGIGTGARKTCKNCSWTLDAYLIFVTNAANAVRVKVLAECKKNPEKRENYCFGLNLYHNSDHVNVLFYTKCAILHRYQCFILHLVFDFTLGV